MKFALSFLLLCTLAASSLAASRDRNNKPYKVVCYWGTWAYYRQGGDGHFQAEDVNPNVCTHVIYGFAKLQGNQIALYDPGLDDGDTDWRSGMTWGHGMIRRMNNLRNYNKHLTTMISIGGWNEGSNKYSAMASNPAARTQFVQSVVAFLKKFDLDGFDFDWEYPAMKAAGGDTRLPGRDADKGDFITLLKELKAAFEPHGFVLSAPASPGAPTIDRAYDIPELNKVLDFVNLMAYDFHGGWDTKTAHNAPLHALPGATGIDKQFVVDYAVDYWISKGMDPHKIILGVPLYGRTFTLAGAANGIGAPVTGSGGTAGPITKQVGMLGYNEICSMIKNGWELKRNDIQKIPYAVHANQWIGYDDEQSVTDKINFAISKKLGGGMVWSVDTDDFNGHCGKGKYPLLKTISRLLNHVDGPDVIIHETHVTGTPDPNNNNNNNQHTNPPDNHHTNPPDNNNNGGTFKCTKQGFFADPTDKGKFHQCVDVGNGKLKDFVFKCPAGTAYNAERRTCG